MFITGNVAWFCSAGRSFSPPSTAPSSNRAQVAASEAFQVLAEKRLSEELMMKSVESYLQGQTLPAKAFLFLLKRADGAELVKLGKVLSCPSLSHFVSIRSERS